MGRAGVRRDAGNGEKCETFSRRGDGRREKEKKMRDMKFFFLTPVRKSLRAMEFFRCAREREKEERRKDRGERERGACKREMERGRQRERE